MSCVDFLFKYENRYRPFLIINFLAALGHLANAVFSIFGASDNGRKINFPVYRSYVAWDTLDCNSTNSSQYSDTSFGFQEFIITPASTEQGFSLNLLTLIVSFHLLSFAFQMVVYMTDYSENIIERGINFLRFVEYSISASIMLVCIAFISNVVSLPSIMALFFMSFATMILGGIAEALFDDHMVNVRSSDYTNDYIPMYLRTLGWFAHFTGWVTLLAAYGVIIFDSFVLSVDKSGVELPWFVPFIVIGIFYFYMVFGAIQLLQLCVKDPCMGTVWGPCCGKKWYKPLRKGSDVSAELNIVTRAWNRICCCCRVRDDDLGAPPMNFNEFTELIYVFNSLIAKTILGWVIISQLLSDESMSGGPLPTCDSIA